jgi:hypothetical protein
MRSLVPTALIVVCAIASCGVIVRADEFASTDKPLPAPIGHAQPRAFSFDSQAEKTVQDRLSAFDEEQKKLDELLDKRLTICRC